MQKHLDSNKKRLDNRCIICFRKSNEEHHIVPRSLGGEDNKENKVTLCQKHHREVHNTGAVNWIAKLTKLRKKRLKQFEIQKRKD